MHDNTFAAQYLLFKQGRMECKAVAFAHGMLGGKMACFFLNI